MEYIHAETRFGALVGDATGLSSTAVLGLAGLLLLASIVLVFLAWLRGRRVGSVLILLVSVIGSLWFLAPMSWTEGRLDLDESRVSLGIGIAVGAALLFGLFAALRLAKPSSWWAQRLYPSEKYDRSVERHGWSRIKAR